MLYAKSKNLSLSNVTLISDYVVLLIRAVPTVVSDRAPDIEKRRNLCPLSGTGAVAGEAEVSEQFSSSARPAAHENMSVDSAPVCATLSPPPPLHRAGGHCVAVLGSEGQLPLQGRGRRGRDRRARRPRREPAARVAGQLVLIGLKFEV